MPTRAKATAAVKTVFGTSLISLVMVSGALSVRSVQAAPVPVQSCANGPVSGAGHLALVTVQNNQQSIYLTTASGTPRACLATLASTAQVQLPSWSPSGQYIAFVLAYSKDGGLSQAFTLYVVNGDGSNPHPVSAPVTGLSYSWSPDSQHIVFSQQGVLTVTNLSGAVTPLLSSSEAGDFSPAWSPDGKLIAYTRNDGLYVVSANGTNSHNVSNPAHNLPDSADQYPIWSPDSQHIAFRSIRDGAQNEQVYVVNADGSHLAHVSDLKLRNDTDRTIAWAPNSSQLAFTSRGIPTGSPSYVLIVNADGSNPHRLTKNANNETHPAWSKDGKWLAIQVTISQTQQNVHVVDVAGATEHNLSTSLLSDVTPFWQP